MTTSNDYYSQLEPFRRNRLKQIKNIILSAFPKATPSMKYKMPTFELGSNWVAIASQKNYISVYTCCYDHIAEFRTKHPHVKGGKGCLNFKDTDDLFETDLKKVIRKALTFKK